MYISVYDEYIYTHTHTYGLWPHFLAEIHKPLEHLLLFILRYQLGVLQFHSDTIYPESEGRS